jgi:hypothetical protein
MVEGLGRVGVGKRIVKKIRLFDSPFGLRPGSGTKGENHTTSIRDNFVVYNIFCQNSYSL